MKLPSFSVEKFLGNASDAFEECSSLAEALHTYGSVIVKDSRIDELENESYLDLMERYFAQPKEEKLNDARAELHYQVVEKSTCLLRIIKSLSR
jgi:isopenicillin N synthase-like dioxygenase